MAIIKDHYHEVPDQSAGDPIVIPLAPLNWSAGDLRLQAPPDNPVNIYAGNKDVVGGGAAVLRAGAWDSETGPYGGVVALNGPVTADAGTDSFLSGGDFSGDGPYGGMVTLGGATETTGGDVTITLDSDANVRIANLPTADPEVAGALYSDGVPSAGVPKALMVSGGPA